MSMSDCMILGNTGSGKTQLYRRLIGEKYNPHHYPSGGASFNVVKYDEATIRLWDTGSPEFIFPRLTTSFFRSTDLYIYCVDLSKPINVSEITKRIADLKAVNANANIILVATKEDAPQARDSRAEFDALDLPDVHKKFVTSAANDNGINEFIAYFHHYTKTFQAYAAAELDLKLELDNLPKDKDQAISLEMQTIRGVLNDRNLNAEEKTDAINAFSDKCHRILEGKYVRAAKAVLTFIGTAIAVAALGFAVGFWLGAWTGPLAFGSGLAVGSAAAIAVIATGSAAGVLGGLYSFFKRPTGTESVNTYVDHLKMKAE